MRLVKRGQQSAPIEIIGIDGKDIAKLNLPTDSDSVEAVSLDGNGKFLAAKTYNGEVLVYDIRANLVVHKWRNVEGSLTELFFSDDARYLTALHHYNDDGVQVFDLVNDKLLWSKRIKQATSAVIDANALLVGQYLGGTKAFDLNSGDPLPNRAREKEAIVGKSKDGVAVAWRVADTIFVRRSDDPLSILSRQKTQFLELSSLSPDGTYLALSENGAKTVRIRRVDLSGTQQLDGLNEKSLVSFGGFSGNGDLLALAGEDGQISTY